MRETAHPGHARELAREASAKHARLVVAAGGDGTISEVAAGLSGRGAALGVIPLGTANVLAHELGLPFKADTIAAALAFSRTRQLWPGIARSQLGERLFVQMLGVGLDAQVVHNMPRGLKRLLGRSAYVARTLAESTRYKFNPIKVLIDGCPAEAGSVVISKGRNYAGRYVLAPEADSAAPGFSVALFSGRGPASAMYYGAALTMNCLPHAPGLRLIRARRVEVLGVAPAQADGDPAGASPFFIEDADAPLNVVTG